jgi:nucleoside-triphosphatase THEP1
MVNGRTRILHVGDAPFPLPAEPGTRWILTGGKNAGKTTTLLAWIDVWRAQGFALSGVFTRTCFDGDRHIGYDVVEIASGIVHPVIRREPFARSLKQGEFHFDEDGFRAINVALMEAPSPDLFILDEIGPLELNQHTGFFPTLNCFLGRELPLLLVTRESYLSEFAAFR